MLLFRISYATPIPLLLVIQAKAKTMGNLTNQEFARTQYRHWILEFSATETCGDTGIIAMWLLLVEQVANRLSWSFRSTIKNSTYFNCLKLLRETLKYIKGSAGDSDDKEPACNAGDLGSTTELGRSNEEGNGYTLQYSYLENFMDRGAWQATVHGVEKSQTWLRD